MKKVDNKCKRTPRNRKKVENLAEWIYNQPAAFKILVKTQKKYTSISAKKVVVLDELMNLK